MNNASFRLDQIPVVGNYLNNFTRQLPQISVEGTKQAAWRALAPLFDRNTYIPIARELRAKIENNKWTTAAAVFCLILGATFHYFNPTLVYEGQKDQAGRLHGQGKLTFPNGTVLQGEFMEGKLWNGTVTSTPIRRPGPGIKSSTKKFVNGKPEPAVHIVECTDGRVYKGCLDVQTGLSHGPGEYTFRGGTRIQALFLRGKIDERHAVKTIWSTGIWIEGQMVNGVYNGVGQMGQPDGAVFEGHFMGGKPDWKKYAKRTTPDSVYEYFPMTHDGVGYTLVRMNGKTIAIGDVNDQGVVTSRMSVAEYEGIDPPSDINTQKGEC